jgi:RNA processing factor Prp31
LDTTTLAARSSSGKLRARTAWQSDANIYSSVQKQDNHIIQAIATLDQIDKDLNTFCMRLRENYGIFPPFLETWNSC